PLGRKRACRRGVSGGCASSAARASGPSGSRCSIHPSYGGSARKVPNEQLFPSRPRSPARADAFVHASVCCATDTQGAEEKPMNLSRAGLSVLLVSAVWAAPLGSSPTLAAGRAGAVTVVHPLVSVGVAASQRLQVNVVNDSIERADARGAD